MDEFEQEFPDFDWRNIPLNEHTNGTKCPCPTHEYIREQAKIKSKQNLADALSFTVNLCPEHYKVHIEEMAKNQQDIKYY